MNRFWATLIVVCLALASAAGGVLVAWQAQVHFVPLFYIIGPLAVVIGTGSRSPARITVEGQFRPPGRGDSRARIDSDGRPRHLAGGACRWRR